MPNWPSASASLPSASQLETLGDRRARETGAYACQHCHDKGVIRDPFLPITDPNFGKVFPCPHCTPTKRSAGQQHLAARSGLVQGALGLTLDNIYERGDGSTLMLSEVRRMIEKPYGMLTLYGGPGNGKTLALQVAVNGFIMQGMTARYYRMADLLDELRSGFDDHAKLDESDLYADINRCQLLAIDEFDKPRLTPYAQEVIFRLLDDRYLCGRPGMTDERRHTVLAMNIHPETLPAYLVSRLRWGINDPDGFRIVYNTDSDARESGL